ncbi:hypothetical protein N431DRAFT_446284 [Stipitochalara longipes BDJ]|nr:hypothetical protein N431DRAFT_446284 [Stipitochalara longipes BDJ]
MAEPQEFQEKAIDVEMAETQEYNKKDADVEMAGPPQYHAKDADIEKADDVPIQHTWLCPGGDPAHCGCLRPEIRFDRFLWNLNWWQVLGLNLVFALLLMAIILLIVYGMVAATETGDTQVQAMNCTSFKAPDLVGCMNGTKLD